MLRRCTYNRPRAATRLTTRIPTKTTSSFSSASYLPLLNLNVTKTRTYCSTSESTRPPSATESQPRGRRGRTISPEKEARMMQLWKNVKFIVYDLPQSKKPYEERMKELDEMFTNPDGTPNNPVIRVAPRQICQSREHLEEALEVVSNRGGEGIILREPGSYYIPGPSDSMREVKLVREEDVIFVDRFKRNRGLKCKMRDGREIIVECPPIVFAEPPPLNSIITVSYTSRTSDGLLKNAQYVKTKVPGNNIAEPEDTEEKQVQKLLQQEESHS